MLVVLLLLPLLPLPWRVAPPSAGPGTAWRVDGRLEVAGVGLDPPGEVLWLAAGRPQLLWERLREGLAGGPAAVPLTRGDEITTPSAAVPAAVAAALGAAGRPTDTADGARIGLVVGPVDLGRLGARLHLGDSHGLAVAVTVLRDLGAVDLGTERVAATGRVMSDGGVHDVGGIRPKVRAAVRSGATTILVPRAQVGTARDAITTPGVTIRGVGNLAELLED